MRVTIGDKSLKDGNIEVKARSEKEKELIPLENAVEAIKALLEKLN